MNAFFTALCDLFKAEPHNAFHNSIEGRFSYGETVEGGSKPYAVFFGLPCISADTFTEKIDELSFQVNVYTNGNYLEAGTILQYCRDLFDGAVLIVNDLDVVITREMETPPWRNGGLWTASIEFNAIIQEV